LVNDADGWNAWQVVDMDNTTAQGMFDYYWLTLPTNVDNDAQRFGWIFSVRGRLVSNNGTSSALYALYETDQLFRFTENFDFDNAGDLRVGLYYTNGYSYTTYTTGSTGSVDYHLHQVVYDPVTALASYYFDGQFMTNWPGAYLASTVPEIVWGAVSGVSEGTMNYNLVEFDSVAGPLVSLALNGSNVVVSYRGILEATSQLGKTAAWTPVATNSTSGTNIYSLPASSQAAQFFRARMVQ
jgi:hypothetical protein